MARLLGLLVILIACLGVRSQNTQSEPSMITSSTLKTTTSTEKTTTAKVYSTTDGRTAVCNAYCNVYGYYVPRRICVSITGRKVYCCGDFKYRYCCTDSSKALRDSYPDVRSCPNSAWWLFHWRIIVGLLGTVMVIMMCGACIYYCCIGLCKKNERVQRVRRRFTSNPDDVQVHNFPNETRNGGAETHSTAFMFDPSNPNAFVPPPYESLPKDPPKYNDIFTTPTSGQDNQAFQAEGSTSTAEGATAAAAAVTLGAGAAALATASGTTASAGDSGSYQATASASSAAGTTTTAAVPSTVPGSPNRTTVVTPQATALAGGTTVTGDTNAGMAEVDSPPAYSRTDPATIQANTHTVTPSAVNIGNQQSQSSVMATPSVDSGNVQRIEVGAAVGAADGATANTGGDRK